MHREAQPPVVLSHVQSLCVQTPEHCIACRATLVRVDTYKLTGGAWLCALCTILLQSPASSMLQPALCWSALAAASLWESCLSPLVCPAPFPASLLLVVQVWFDRRCSYTRSLAVMSMVGYVLGLGDRHPSNLMLDRTTGHVVHIDFGDCFEVCWPHSHAHTDRRTDGHTL